MANRVTKQMKALFAPTDDPDFGARVARLEGQLSVCRGAEANELMEQLRDLKKLRDLGSLAPRPSPGDLNLVHLIEAELAGCLPTELLYPFFLEHKEKLYRLPAAEREALLQDLTSRFENGEVKPDDEATVRLRLQNLVLEIYAASTNYTRITAERSEVISRLTVVALITIGILLIASVVALRWWNGTGRVLVLASLAGSVSAAMSAFSSTVQEKLRREMQNMLVAEMIRRSILGGITAGFVYLAVVSGFVSIGNIQGMDDPNRTRVFLALGFATGWSERIFRQALSPFIVGDKSSGAGDKTSSGNDKREKTKTPK